MTSGNATAASPTAIAQGCRKLMTPSPGAFHEEPAERFHVRYLHRYAPVVAPRGERQRSHRGGVGFERSPVSHGNVGGRALGHTVLFHTFEAIRQSRGQVLFLWMDDVQRDHVP